MDLQGINEKIEIKFLLIYKIIRIDPWGDENVLYLYVIVDTCTYTCAKIVYH